jgi:hypothetical protein
MPAVVDIIKGKLVDLNEADGEWVAHMYKWLTQKRKQRKQAHVGNYQWTTEDLQDYKDFLVASP